MSAHHGGELAHDDYEVHKLEPGVVIKPNTGWIWKVFWIMLAITIVELVVGFQAESWHLSKIFLKFFFIGFTILKAYYIVFAFMHLKDEVKGLRFTIIVPFTVFILYLIYIAMVEGVYSSEHKPIIDAVYTSAKAAAHH